MNDTIIVAIISLIGTFIGSFSGMSLVKYRINELEKRVNKHNKLIDRMYKVEEDIAIINEKIMRN